MEEELAKFAEAIQENKHLHSEEEIYELMIIWEKEYHMHLIKKYFKT